MTSDTPEKAVEAKRRERRREQRHERGHPFTEDPPDKVPKIGPMMLPIPPTARIPGTRWSPGMGTARVDRDDVVGPEGTRHAGVEAAEEERQEFVPKTFTPMTAAARSLSLTATKALSDVAPHEIPCGKGREEHDREREEVVAGLGVEDHAGKRRPGTERPQIPPVRADQCCITQIRMKYAPRVVIAR